MKILQTVIVLVAIFFSSSHLATAAKTVVSIHNNQFCINGELTNKNRVWKGRSIEGLLFNSRMVQGIFDDLNPETRDQFAYADTQKWDAERNTREFVMAMDDWHNAGLNAITLNLQGGSPLGYGNNGWINSTFDADGNLRPAYLKRLEMILDKADKIGMVVILGYFYFGQDEHLLNEKAVLKATDNITRWIVKKGYRNLLIEINNECDIYYDHKILQPQRVAELIDRVKIHCKRKSPLYVSTSFSGGIIPTAAVLEKSDFVLIHANTVDTQQGLINLIDSTRRVEGCNNKPIIINEDDHFDFESDSCNFSTATQNYVSWGYFDYRMKDEGFNDGFQSVPVNWTINSERKIQFFNKLKEITGK